MKEIKYLAVLAAIVFAMTLGLKAQVPPDCVDEDCPSWTWFDCLPLDFEYPGTSCTFTVYFEAQLCNGQMNFRLKTISMPDTPECQGLILLVLPDGLGGFARQEILVDITSAASVEIMKRYFLLERAQAPDPSIYDCDQPGGQTIRYRIVTKGGCVKYVRAYRPASPQYGPGVIHWKLAKCSDDGCCYMDRELCWDSALGEVRVTDGPPTVVGAITDCHLKQAQEDPFVNYPKPPWVVPNIMEPCMNQCYIY